MNKPSNMSEALTWVSRVLSVGVIMGGCGWLGNLLDSWIGTSFLTIVGFLIGMTIGLAGLIGLVLRAQPPRAGGS